MKFTYDDGGRSRYFRGKTNDCATRAMAITTGRDYKVIYDELRELTGESPRNGIDIRQPKLRQWLADQGLEWVPTMKVGKGCTVHLNADELPAGRLICRCSKHLVAVIDGVIHDTYDSSREGKRCVYGYWQQQIH